MITDKIEQLKRYAVPKTEAILRFVAEHDCANLPDGEMEIEGRQLFVRVMSYVPKPASENRFEIHHHHADVQYLVSGTEIMQIACLTELTPVSEYDAKGDYHFFTTSNAASSFIVKAGEFAVFYPNQPHRPSCLLEGHKDLVKKLVFKVRIDQP